MFRSLSLSSLQVLFRLCGILTKYFLLLLDWERFLSVIFCLQYTFVLEYSFKRNVYKLLLFQSCGCRNWCICIYICLCVCRKNGSAPLMQLTLALWVPSPRSKSATACITFAMASHLLTPPSSPSLRMVSLRTAAAD